MASAMKKTQFDPQDDSIVGRRGTESRILYNGLVMNDRRISDSYVITEITGLDDPDIRDSRTDNQDADGETPYLAYNGGRTVTLKGYIRAGNMAKIRAMENSMVQAFSTLEESSMSFLYLDEYINFSNSADLFDWSADSGAGTYNISTSTDELTFTDAAEKIIYHNARKRKDCGAKVYVNLNGVNTGTGFADAIIKRVGSKQYLCARWNVSTNTLIIGVRNDVTFTALSTVSLSFTPSTSILLCGEIVDNQVNAWVVYNETDPEFFSYKEMDGTMSDCLATTNTTLTSTNATTYGAGVYGWGGFCVDAPATGWTVDSVDVFGINPGDLRIKCRKFGKIEFSYSQSSNSPRTDFLITVRSSDGLLESRHPIVYFASGVTSILSFVGGVLTFPQSGSGLILGGQAIVLDNPGIRSTSFQAVIDNTSTTDSGIGVLQDDGSISWALGTTDMVTIDTKNREITSTSTGDNYYKYLSDSYSWIRLLPGANSIFVSTSTTATVNIWIWYRPVF